MLSLQNAGKRYGPRVLFLEANWLIRSREKTALRRKREEKRGVGGPKRREKPPLPDASGGAGDAGLRPDAADPRHEHRLPAAGGAGADRPNGLRGVPDGFRRAARDGSRGGAAGRATGRAGPWRHGGRGRSRP